MAYKVHFSEQAAVDLDEIIKYINDELCSPQAAGRFFHVVNEKIGLLRDNPYMFPLYHNERLSAEGYHSVVIRNFLMFYLVDDGEMNVNISRILYGMRDIPAVFGKSES